MFMFKMPKAPIVKLNLKRVITLLFLSVMVYFIPVGLAMAESQQNLQPGAVLDGYSGIGTAKGMGLWILFTLAISFGLNNYLRKKENSQENKKG